MSQHFKFIATKIDIAWPLDVTEMSDRDRNNTLLD